MHTVQQNVIIAIIRFRKISLIIICIPTSAWMVINHRGKMKCNQKNYTLKYIQLFDLVRNSLHMLCTIYLRSRPLIVTEQRMKITCNVKRSVKNSRILSCNFFEKSSRNNIHLQPIALVMIDHRGEISCNVERHCSKDSANAIHFRRKSL